MRRLMVGMLYASMLSTVAACGSATRRTGDRGMDPQREVAVSVKNENFYDATVYACWGRLEDRLGVVNSNATRDFTSRWASRDLRLLVDFTGGGRFLSELLSVEPGDQLQFIITINMHRGRGNARCI